MTELSTKRGLNEIAAEIRYLDRHAAEILMGHAIEIGNRLAEAKELVPYGEWGDWLRREFDYSQSTAQNMMRIAKEYGAAQMGLFGPELESQTFGKLSYSKALQLLALPREEREEFVQENDVEAMSTRELAAAIKEKKAAEEAREKAEQEALALKEKIRALEEEDNRAGEELSEAQERAENAEAETERLRREIKELESRPVEVAVEIDQEAIEEAVEKAKAEAAQEKERLEQELKEAGEKLLSAAQERDKAKEAAKKAKEKLKTAQEEAEKAAGEKVAAAEAKAKEADREREKSAGEAEKLRKQLRMADPQVTAFGVLLQVAADALDEVWQKLEEIEDVDKSERCKTALRQMMEDYLPEETGDSGQMVDTPTAQDDGMEHGSQTVDAPAPTADEKGLKGDEAEEQIATSPSALSNDTQEMVEAVAV